MRRLLLMSAGDLAAALEKEIAKNGTGPSTPEEWERFLSGLEAEGTAKKVGEVPDSATAGYIAGSLRDEGVGARVLKPGDKKDG